MWLQVPWNHFSQISMHFSANITLNRGAQFLKDFPLWEALCKLKHSLQISPAMLAKRYWTSGYYMRLIETSLPRSVSVHTATGELIKANTKVLYIFVYILSLHHMDLIPFLLFSKHLKLGTKMGKKKKNRRKNRSQ